MDKLFCIWLPEIGFSGLNPESARKMGLKRHVEQGFSSFFAKFWANLMIFLKIRIAPSIFYEKSTNLTKILQKMKKSLVQLAFSPLFHGTTGTRKSDCYHH